MPPESAYKTGVLCCNGAQDVNNKRFADVHSNHGGPLPLVHPPCSIVVGSRPNMVAVIFRYPPHISVSYTHLTLPTKA